jgi:predicted lipoprotein with Yx(FWY)xxD motif
MSTVTRRFAAFLIVPAILILVAACSGAGGAGAGAVASASAAPVAAGSASAAPSASSAGRGSDYDYGSGSSPSPAASAAADGAVEIGTGTGAPGTFLTGAGGMTLYTFTKDSANTSACGSDCAGNWPPLTVAAGVTPTAGSGVTGLLTTFARADGSLQVAYDGKPLYYFANDKAAGDTNGQGIGGFWFIAHP